MLVLPELLKYRPTSGNNAICVNGSLLQYPCSTYPMHVLHNVQPSQLWDSDVVPSCQTYVGTRLMVTIVLLTFLSFLMSLNWQCIRGVCSVGRCSQ